MTGASINDLKSFFSQNDPSFSVIRSPGQQEGDNSFSKAMSEARTRPVNQQESGGFQGVEDKRGQGRLEVERTGRQEVEQRSDKAVNGQADNTGAEKDVSGLDEGNVRQELRERIEKIRKAIKDQLGISDEELNAAMENLNLATAELLNPDSVKALMMEVSGIDNPVDLLTNEELLSGINSVLSEVSDIISEFKQEFSLSDEEFAAIAAELENSDEAVLMQAGADFGDALEGPSDETEDLKERPVEAEKPVQGAAKDGAEAKDTADVLQSENSQSIAFKQDPKKNGFGQEQGRGNENEGAQLQMPQTIVQTEVTQTGEVVETVRSYSSYTSETEIIGQVTEQIRMNISPEKTSMEMMLHPASLGAVNIQVTQQGDMLHARILVQNEQVREAIAGQMEQLLKTFEEQGQKVTEIDVSVANYNLEHGFHQNPEDQGSNPGRQGESDGSRRLRRTLDLNALTDEDISELSDEDRLKTEVMSMSGTSVEYRA